MRIKNLEPVKIFFFWLCQFLEAKNLSFLNESFLNQFFYNFTPKTFKFLRVLFFVPLGEPIKFLCRTQQHREERSERVFG